MSAEQGSSKVLALAESETAPDSIEALASVEPVGPIDSVGSVEIGRAHV